MNKKPKKKAKRKKKPEEQPDFLTEENLEAHGISSSVLQDEEDEEMNDD